MHSGPNPAGGPPIGPRVFRPYTDCEEFADNGGMWKPLLGAQIREKVTESAARLMKDTRRFRAAMVRAVQEWPLSCESNLTAEGNNQRAWLGRAGCYLAVGSPEDCTRLGWHRLNPAQQRAANETADEVIRLWARRYRPPSQVTGQLDIFGDADA